MDFGMLSTLVSLLGTLFEGPDTFALNPPPKSSENAANSPS
jgi:hypothetical protein